MKNHSALVGLPSDSQVDYWLIRGMFRYVGMDDASTHPTDGYTMVPSIPNTQKDE